MKKIVKRACAGMFAALMAVSAMSVPSSATSVSGSVGGYSCGGSNTITYKNASAETYASVPMTLNVTLFYTYVYKVPHPDVHYTKKATNANSPVSYIEAHYSKPSSQDYYSYCCYSKHNAIHSSSVGYDSWQDMTTLNMY